MKMYFINSFLNSHVEYRFHQEGCPKLANFLSREFLDLSTSPGAAIKKAQKLYPDSKPCYCCAKSPFSFQRIINGEFLTKLFEVYKL